MSKKEIQRVKTNEDAVYLSQAQLGSIDSVQYFVYGFVAFAGGVIADRYDQRLLISIAYFGLGICCLA